MQTSHTMKSQLRCVAFLLVHLCTIGPQTRDVPAADLVWREVVDVTGLKSLAAFKDFALFSAADGLYRTDGRTVRKISEIAPAGLQIFDDYIYGRLESSIYRTDGFVVDAFTNLEITSDLTGFGSQLYFATPDALYRTDGATTSKVVDSDPIVFMFPRGDELFYFANPVDTDGGSLFVNGPIYRLSPEGQSMEVRVPGNYGRIAILSSTWWRDSLYYWEDVIDVSPPLRQLVRRTGDSTVPILNADAQPITAPARLGNYRLSDYNDELYFCDGNGSLLKADHEEEIETLPLPPGVLCSDALDFEYQGRLLISTIADNEYGVLFATDGTDMVPVADTAAQPIAEFAGELVYSVSRSVFHTDGERVSLLQEAPGSHLDTVLIGGRLLIGNADGLHKVTIAGDANEDGTVDFGDFLVLSEGYGNIDDWYSGDFDLDGKVGFADFLLLSQNFGTSIGEAVTPGVVAPEACCGKFTAMLALSLIMSLRSRSRLPSDIRTSQTIAPHRGAPADQREGSTLVPNGVRLPRKKLIFDSNSEAQG